MDELSDSIRLVEGLGYRLFPDAHCWLFEFACQYVESFNANPITQANLLPRIMYSKAKSLEEDGEFSFRLDEKDIPYIIRDIKEKGASLAFNQYNSPTSL
ncbi:MAG: hypothetical protein KC535_02120 [Nanoarchaeota archaeon]|nr:hypothetical protein [Nanoarchaeota archaeon]